MWSDSGSFGCRAPRVLRDRICHQPSTCVRSVAASEKFQGGFEPQLSRRWYTKLWTLCLPRRSTALQNPHGLHRPAASCSRGWDTLCGSSRNWDAAFVIPGIRAREAASLPCRRRGHKVGVQILRCVSRPDSTTPGTVRVGARLCPILCSPANPTNCHELRLQL
jgi:hypothetical protein